MYTKKRYGARDMFIWTRFETFNFFIIALAVLLLYEVVGLKWLNFPWTPIALVGTAVAFVIGFQNNAAYGRIWEARKIWGGIVNTSRTFGMKVKDMVTAEHTTTKVTQAEIDQEIKTLTYRHIAWMTALRHAMRQKKSWEVFTNEKSNRDWANTAHPPEWVSDLKEDLVPYLNQEDLEYTLGKSNKQTALLYLQSNHLRKLKEQGLVWEFAFLELENSLEELFTLQGKSERIKNFPYPRQFATLNHYFMWIFILLLPFGIVPQFDDLGREIASNFPLIGTYFVWAAIPFCMAVSWIFHTMERIGRTGENPFEGTANDVPISTIARGIEIDLRQNLNERKEEIPAQFEMIYDIQY
jgi:putative membrane protein